MKSMSGLYVECISVCRGYVECISFRSIFCWSHLCQEIVIRSILKISMSVPVREICLREEYISIKSEV